MIPILEDLKWKKFRGLLQGPADPRLAPFTPVKWMEQLNSAPAIRCVGFMAVGSTRVLFYFRGALFQGGNDAHHGPHRNAFASASCLAGLLAD